MSDDNRVIKRKRMPFYPPWALTISLGLLLDRLHSPGWVWGAVGTLMGLMWLVCIHGMSTEKQIDVFEEVNK